MTMAEILSYRRKLRADADTRKFRQLMAAVSGGLFVMACAFVVLIVLA